MDTIEVKSYKTKFASAEHPMIFVNSSSLDELLENYFENDWLVGLVPSVTWLWNEEEKFIAIERLKNKIIGSTIVPLLVCPDDCDFACSVLIVEVENKEESVMWNRFGFDRSHNGVVGTTVEWFEKELRFEFAKSSYEQFRDVIVKLGSSG